MRLMMIGICCICCRCSSIVPALDSDISIADVVGDDWRLLQVFAKCGVLKEDDDRKPKVKVYRDRETQVPKGDGLVTYLKEPSVS